MQADTLGQYFLPSEICRLVLGFLKEENYMETYWCFLKECVHLAEYSSLLKRGREYPTTIMGLSLLAMLDDYAKLKLHQGVFTNTSPQAGGMPSVMNQLDSVLTTLKNIPQQQNRQFYTDLTQSSRTKIRNREQQGRPSRFLCFNSGTTISPTSTTTRQPGNISGTLGAVPVQTNAVATASSTSSTAEKMDEPDVEVDVVSDETPDMVVTERIGVGVPVPNSSVVLLSMSTPSKMPVSGPAYLSNNVLSTAASSASCSTSAVASSVVLSSPSAGPSSGKQHASDRTVITSKAGSTVSSVQQPSSPAAAPSVAAISAMEAGPSGPNRTLVECGTGSSFEPEQGGDEATQLNSVPAVVTPGSVSGSKTSGSQYFTPVTGPRTSSMSASQPSSGSSVFITPSSQLSPPKETVLSDEGSFTQVPDVDTLNPDFSRASTKQAASKRRKKTPKRRQNSVGDSGAEDIRIFFRQKMDKAIKTAVNSSHLLNGLADKINKGWYDAHKQQQQQTSTTADQSQHSKAAAAIDSQGSSSTDLTRMDLYMESILNKDQFMSEDAVKNIINMTRNENILDDVFDIFGVEKEEFLEREFGIGNLSRLNPTAPTTSSSQEGLHTPPHSPQSELGLHRPSTSAPSTSVTTTTTIITNNAASTSRSSGLREVTFSTKSFNLGNDLEEQVGASGSGDPVQILSRGLEPAQPFSDGEKPSGPEEPEEDFLKVVGSVQPVSDENKLCSVAEGEKMQTVEYLDERTGKLVEVVPVESDNEVVFVESDRVCDPASSGDKARILDLTNSGNLDTPTSFAASCSQGDDSVTSNPVLIASEFSNVTERKTLGEKLKSEYLDEQTGNMAEVISVESDGTCGSAGGDNTGIMSDTQISFKSSVPLSSGNVGTPSSAPLRSQDDINPTSAGHHSSGSVFPSSEVSPTFREKPMHSMTVNSEHSYCYSQGDAEGRPQGHNPAADYLEDSLFSEPPQTPATPQVCDGTPISPLRSRWGRLAAAQAAEEASSEHVCQFDGTPYGAVVIRDLSGCNGNTVPSADGKKSLNLMLPPESDASTGSQGLSMDSRIIHLSTPEVSAETGSGMSSALQISQSSLGRSHLQINETQSFNERMEGQAVHEVQESQQLSSPLCEMQREVNSEYPATTPLQGPQQSPPCTSKISQASVQKVNVTSDSLQLSVSLEKSLPSREGRSHLSKNSQINPAEEQMSVSSDSTVSCFHQSAALPTELSHTSQLPHESERSLNLFKSLAKTQNVFPITRSSPFHVRSSKSYQSPRKSELLSSASLSKSSLLAQAALPFPQSTNQLHESENQPISELTPSKSKPSPIQALNQSPVQFSPTKLGRSRIPDSAKSTSQQSLTPKILSASMQPTDSGYSQVPDHAKSSAANSQKSPASKSSTINPQKSSASEQSVEDELTHAASVFVRLKHMLSQSHLAERQSSTTAVSEPGMTDEQLSEFSVLHSHQMSKRRSDHAMDIGDGGDGRSTLESQHTPIHLGGGDAYEAVCSGSVHSGNSVTISAERLDQSYHGDLNVSESKSRKQLVSQQSETQDSDPHQQLTSEPLDGQQLAFPLTQTTHVVHKSGKKLTTLHTEMNSVPHTLPHQHPTSKRADGKQLSFPHTQTMHSVPVGERQQLVPGTPPRQKPLSPPPAHQTPNRVVHRTPPDSVHRTPPRAAHQISPRPFQRTPPHSRYRTSPRRAGHHLPGQFTLFSPIKSPFSPRSASSINSNMSPGRLRLLNEPVPEEVLEELSRHSDSCFSDTASVGQPGSPWTPTRVVHLPRIDEEAQPGVLEGSTFHRSGFQHSPVCSAQSSYSRSASAVSRKLAELSQPPAVHQQPSVHVSSAQESNHSKKEHSEARQNRGFILSRHVTREGSASRDTCPKVHKVGNVVGEQHSSSGDIFISPGFNDEVGGATISMPFPVAVQQFLNNQIETGELQVPLDLTNHDLAFSCNKTPTPSPEKLATPKKVSRLRRSPRRTPKKQAIVKRLSVQIGQCGSLSTSRARGKGNTPKKKSPSKTPSPEKRSTRASKEQKGLDHEEVETNAKKLRLRQPRPFAEVSGSQHVTLEGSASGTIQESYVAVGIKEIIAETTDPNEHEPETCEASSLRQQKLALKSQSGTKSPVKLTDKQKKMSPTCRKSETLKNVADNSKANKKTTEDDAASSSKSTKASSINQKKLSPKPTKGKPKKKSAAMVKAKPKEESSDDDFSIYSFSALSSSDYSTSSSSSTDSDVPLIQLVKKKAAKMEKTSTTCTQSKHPGIPQSSCETSALSDLKKNGTSSQQVPDTAVQSSLFGKQAMVVSSGCDIDETDSSPPGTLNSSAFSGAGMGTVRVTAYSDSCTPGQKEVTTTREQKMVCKVMSQEEQSVSAAIPSTSQVSLPPKKRLAAGKKPAANEKTETEVVPKKNPLGRKDLRLLKPKPGQLPRRLPIGRKRLDLLQPGSPEHPNDKDNDSDGDSDTSSTKSLSPTSIGSKDTTVSSEYQAQAERMESIPATVRNNKNTIAEVIVENPAESEDVGSVSSTVRKPQDTTSPGSTEKPMQGSKGRGTIDMDKVSSTSSEEVDVCELSDEEGGDLKKEKTPTSQSDRKKKAIIAARKHANKSKSRQGSSKSGSTSSVSQKSNPGKKSKSGSSTSQKSSTPVKKRHSAGSKLSSEKKGNTNASAGGSTQGPASTGWGQQNQTFHFMPMAHPPQGVGIQKYGPYRRIKPIMLSKDISSYFASVRNQAGARQNMFDIGPVPSPSCSVFSTTTSPVATETEQPSGHAQTLEDASPNTPAAMGSRASKNAASPNGGAWATSSPLKSTRCSSSLKSTRNSSTASASSGDRSAPCEIMTVPSSYGPTQLKSPPTGLAGSVLSTVLPTAFAPRASQGRLVGDIVDSPTPVATSTPCATAPLASILPKKTGVLVSASGKETRAASWSKSATPKKTSRAKKQKDVAASPKPTKKKQVLEKNVEMALPEVVQGPGSPSTKKPSQHAHQGSAVETDDGTIAITFDSIETEEAVRALMELRSPEKLQETRDSVIAYRSKEKLCSEQSRDMEEMIVAQERSTDSETLSHPVGSGKGGNKEPVIMNPDEESVYELPDLTSVPGEPPVSSQTSRTFSRLSLKRKREVSPTKAVGNKTPRLEHSLSGGQKAPSKDACIQQMSDVPPGQVWSMPFLGEVTISPSKPRNLPEEVPHQESYSVIRIEDPGPQVSHGNIGGQATSSSLVVSKFSSLLDQLESVEHEVSSGNSGVSVPIERTKKGTRVIKKLIYVQPQNVANQPGPSQLASSDNQHQTIQESAESSMQPQQPPLQLALLPPTGSQTQKQVALIHTQPMPDKNQQQLEKELVEMRKAKRRRSKQPTTPDTSIRKRTTNQSRKTQKNEKVSVVSQEVFLKNDRFGIRTSILLPKLPATPNAVLLPQNLQAQAEGTTSSSPYIIMDEKPERNTKTGPQGDMNIVPQGTVNTDCESPRHINPLDAAMMSALPELVVPSSGTSTMPDQASAVVTVSATPCNLPATAQATQNNFSSKTGQFDMSMASEMEFSEVVTAVSSPQPLIIDPRGRLSEVNSPLLSMPGRKLYSVKLKGTSQLDAGKGIEALPEGQASPFPSLSQDLFGDFMPCAVSVPDAELDISLSSHTLTSLNPVALGDPMLLTSQSSNNAVPAVMGSGSSFPNVTPSYSQAQYNHCSGYTRTPQLTPSSVGYSHAVGPAAVASSVTEGGVLSSSAASGSVMTATPVTSLGSQPNSHGLVSQLGTGPIDSQPKAKKAKKLTTVNIEKFLTRKVHGNNEST